MLKEGTNYENVKLQNQCIVNVSLRTAVLKHQAMKVYGERENKTLRIL
jgi:hypothetical protein